VSSNGFSHLLPTAIHAALQAGEAIRKIYFSDHLLVDYKSDLSPVTLADMHAHEHIEKALLETGYPVLSEEGVNIPYEQRKDWPVYWLVDPLDGTKEFIRRNDDFTVNIGLVKGHRPVLGVVYSPVTGLLYFGELETGAFKRDTCFDCLLEENNFNQFLERSEKLPLKKNRDRFTVVVSKSHINEKTLDFVKLMRERFGDVESISIGSSLKMCMVPEGRADVYPRFGKTMEWDTAAGHAITLAAGFLVTLPDGETPLRYNKPDLANPWFIVRHESMNL
jgi:3'(2'), 5'-bisphosphate nucleotidase